MPLQQVYNPNQLDQALAIQLGNDSRRQQIASSQLNDQLQQQLAPIQIEQAKQNLLQSQQEAPLKAALQKMLLAKQGVFLSPQRPGMPASLPALPVTPDQMSTFNASPLQDALAGNKPDSAFDSSVMAPTPTDQQPLILGNGVVQDPVYKQYADNNEIEKAKVKAEALSRIEQARQIAVKQSDRDFELNNPKPIPLTNPKTGETQMFSPTPGASYPQGFIPTSQVQYHLGDDGATPITGADLKRELEKMREDASAGKIGQRDVLKYSKDTTTELNKLPAIKDYPEIEKRAKAINDDLTHDNKAIADTLMIENLQRLTSNQAIRQQTLNMLTGHQGLWDKIKGKISSTIDGGIGFSDLTRGEVKQVAKVALESAQKARNEILNGYRQSAQQKGDAYGEIFDKEIAPKYPGFKLPEAPGKADETITVDYLKQKFGL